MKLIIKNLDSETAHRLDVFMKSYIKKSKEFEKRGDYMGVSGNKPASIIVEIHGVKRDCGDELLKEIAETIFFESGNIGNSSRFDKFKRANRLSMKPMEYGKGFCDIEAKQMYSWLEGLNDCQVGKLALSKNYGQENLSKTRKFILKGDYENFFSFFLGTGHGKGKTEVDGEKVSDCKIKITAKTGGGDKEKSKTTQSIPELPKGLHSQEIYAYQLFSTDLGSKTLFSKYIATISISQLYKVLCDKLTKTYWPSPGPTGRVWLYCMLVETARLAGWSPVHGHGFDESMRKKIQKYFDDFPSISDFSMEIEKLSKAINNTSGINELAKPKILEIIKKGKIA